MKRSVQAAVSWLRCRRFSTSIPLNFRTCTTHSGTQSLHESRLRDTIQARSMCAEVQRYVEKRCADLNIVQVLVPERRVAGQHLQLGGAPQPWPGQQRHPSALLCLGC